MEILFPLIFFVMWKVGQSSFTANKNVSSSQVIHLCRVPIFMNSLQINHINVLNLWFSIVFNFQKLFKGIKTLFDYSIKYHPSEEKGYHCKLCMVVNSSDSSRCNAKAKQLLWIQGQHKVYRNNFFSNKKDHNFN